VDGLTEARWLPSSRFNLIAGVEASSDSEELLAPERIQRVTGASVGLAGEDKKIPPHQLGRVLELEPQVVDPWLKLTGGVRLDENSIYGRQITGRAGLTSRWSGAIVAKVALRQRVQSSVAVPSLCGSASTWRRGRQPEPQTAIRPQPSSLQFSYKPDRFFGVTSGISNSWIIDKAEFTPQGITRRHAMSRANEVFHGRRVRICVITTTTTSTLRSR